MRDLIRTPVRMVRAAGHLARDIWLTLARWLTPVDFAPACDDPNPQLAASCPCRRGLRCWWVLR